jgi:hypothetical protein
MPIVKVRMPDGSIVEAVDEDGYSDTPQATIGERFRAGLAPEKTRVKAWEDMVGPGNVKVRPNGEILIRKGGTWSPVEGENWTPREIVGDIADYGGELVEDIGAGVGAALGAVKGTAVLPGIGTVAGIGAGGGAGRAAGNVARQGMAQMAGVGRAFEDERLPEIGMAGVEGAIVEPIGFGAGKVIAKGAKAATPYVKEYAGKLGRGLTQMTTGVSEKGTEALYRDPKLVRKIAKDPEKFADETLASLRNRVSADKQDAGKKLGELTEEIFTRNDPINNLSATQQIDEILAKYNVTFDADGKPIADFSTIQNDAEIGKLLDIREKISKVPSVLDARAMRQGLDDIVFLNGQDVSTNFKAARTGIRRVIEDAIEEAAQAKGPGVGDTYKALKEDYTKAATNYDFVDDIFEIPKTGTKASKIIAEERRGLGRIRNLQGAANVPYVDGLERFAAANPHLADDIRGILTVAAGQEWSQFIPASKMDIGRGAMGLLAGAATNAPIPAIGGYVATRPAAARYYLPEIGKASQAAIGSMEGLATPIGEQVSRQATRMASELPGIGERRGMSPVEIESAIIDNAPNLARFARERYGANYKRALDAGMDASTAAFRVISDQLDKGNENVGVVFDSIQSDSGMDRQRFNETAAQILKRYTGVQ